MTESEQNNSDNGPQHQTDGSRIQRRSPQVRPIAPGHCRGNWFVELVRLFVFQFELFNLQFAIFNSPTQHSCRATQAVGSVRL